MYTESREVGKYIRRAQIFAMGSLDLVIDKEKARELLYSETKRYNAGLKNKSVARGISIKEESLFPQLPTEVGASIIDANWVTISKEYWASFLQRIPFGFINADGIVEGGKEINASYEVIKNDLGKIEIHAEDFNEYILFNLMQQDNSVATDPNQYSEKGNYSFFCIDIEVENKRAKELVETKTHAVIEAAKLFTPQEGKDKIELFRAIAAAVDSEITALYAKTMTTEEAQRSILKGIEKDPKLFLKTIENKNSLKSSITIRRYVEAGVLMRSGAVYLLDGEKIGTEEEVIAFIKNPDNDTFVKRMDAKVDEFTVFGNVAV